MYFEGEKALVRDYDLRFCENDPNLLKLLEIWNTPTATKQRNRFELIKSESDLSGSVWLRSLSDNTLENPVSLSSQETYTLFKEGILPDVDEGLIGKYFQTDDLTSLVLTSDNIYSHLLYSGVGNGDIVFGKYPSYACFI
jgi:hypothetical protein